MIKKIIGVISKKIFSSLPETRAFIVKNLLASFFGVNTGQNVRICSSVRFLTQGKVFIGDDTWLGHDFLIVGGGAKVSVGEKCDIAPRVTIATGTHEVLKGKERAAGVGYSESVEISDGCWICTGATILGGTKIGKCSIVAAGALVKGVYPERSLIGGVPARVIKKIEN